MKLLFTFLAVFALAFAASLLFEFNFILKNPPRYALVCLLMGCILWLGYGVIKVVGKNSDESNN